MGVSKNNGKTPQIIHFNRVFHEISHPFWWFSPLFLETPIWGCNFICKDRLGSHLAGVVSCCARLLCDALRPRVIQALRPLLESDAITKVIHDCREDTWSSKRRVKVANSNIALYLDLFS